MPPGIVTVLRPRAPAATKSPICWTRRLTVRFAEGAGLAWTVKEAVPPSVTADVPVMLTEDPPPSFTVTEKLLVVPCGSAPPPTLVPSAAASKLAFEPSAMVTVSALSDTPSAVAVSSSVAVRAPVPEKRTFGVDVPVSRRLTPVLAVPDFLSRLQSPVVTPVPEIDSGTSMTSPATSARPSVTVNSTVPPSVTAPVPMRASETLVGSLSRMVTVAVVREPRESEPDATASRVNVNDLSAVSAELEEVWKLLKNPTADEETLITRVMSLLLRTR